jgi:hypothetical protein
MLDFVLVCYWLHPTVVYVIDLNIFLNVNKATLKKPNCFLSDNYKFKNMQIFLRPNAEIFPLATLLSASNNDWQSF